MTPLKVSNLVYPTFDSNLRPNKHNPFNVYFTNYLMFRKAATFECLSGIKGLAVNILSIL